MRQEFGSAFLASLVLACGSSPQQSPAHLYWVEQPSDCNTSKIRRTDLGSSTTTDVLSVPGSIDDLTVDQSGGMIYFTLGNTVQRIKLDGTGSETLATYQDPSFSTRGVAVDSDAHKAYWATDAGCSPCPSCGPCGSIEGASLDGSNPMTVLTLTGNKNPSSVALNASAGVLYWGDVQFEPQLSSVTTAGLNSTPIYSTPIGSTSLGVANVEVVSSLGKIYWLEEGRSLGVPAPIKRANLDGSSPDTVMTLGGTRASTPRGLSVDPVEGKVYWTESGFCGDSTPGQIRRASLDGSSIETVVSGIGIAIAVKVTR